MVRTYTQNELKWAINLYSRNQNGTICNTGIALRHIMDIALPLWPLRAVQPQMCAHTHRYRGREWGAVWCGCRRFHYTWNGWVTDFLHYTGYIFIYYIHILWIYKQISLIIVKNCPSNILPLCFSSLFINQHNRKILYMANYKTIVWFTCTLS